MLANRLQKRFKHLKKWAQRTGAGAFRLYDRDIPEIPLVLDFYGDTVCLEDAAISGALYKRPYEKNEEDETVWLGAMRESAASALGLRRENVILKMRQRQRGSSQYEKMDDVRLEKNVIEGGLSFKVNLSDYLDTGLFIDRRLLRKIVRDEASGKNVLNLFSYTGSFSVYAAAGGAVSTVSVDLSNTYNAWARENFLLNGFSAELVKYLTTNPTNHTNNTYYTNHTNHTNNANYNNRHIIIRSDVIEFISYAMHEKKLWDIIIVDPPAFSNSKKMIDDFDLNRDLTELICSCLKLLSPDGKIFVSVNVKRNAPSAEELETLLRPFYSNVRVTDLGDKVTDEDFKGRRIPGAFLVNLIAVK